MPGGHWTMKMDVVAMSTARHRSNCRIGGWTKGRGVLWRCGVAACTPPPPPATRPGGERCPPKIVVKNNNEVVLYSLDQDNNSLDNTV